jgi:hypothetical protein
MIFYESLAVILEHTYHNQRNTTVRSKIGDIISYHNNTIDNAENDYDSLSQ